MPSVRGVRSAFARHLWWSDSMLALLLTALAFSPTLTRYIPGHTLPLLRWVLLPCSTIPVAWRRYRPVTVLAVVFGADALMLVIPSHVVVPLSLATAVTIYTVASRCGRAVALRVGGPATVLLAGAIAINSSGSLAKIAAGLSVIVIGLAIGDNLGTRRAYLAELEARAERLERDREEQAARATLEERARIARELHDVIAHNVSVMVVQASAGEELFDSDPRRARDALTAVATTGRDALGELRRLLGVIRPGNPEPPAYDPQPGIAHLPELLKQVRSTGLAVEFVVDGREQPLSEGASLCTFRIIQEALTNTIKHASAARVVISLHYSADELEISVHDDGRGIAAAKANGTGAGLIGMRERAALYGGRVEAGTAEGGGFAVIARLPVGEHLR